jgi:hypothetical protein
MVEFEKTDDEMSLGFPMVPAGRYLWCFDEGVTLAESKDEDSHAKGYRFPLFVDQPIDGDGDTEGMKGSWYVNVIKKDGESNTFGEKTINSILSMTGLVDGFAKKFDGGVNIDNDKLAAALALKLPGKFLDMTHTIKKQGDRENMEFGRIAKYKKASKAAAKSAKKSGEDDNEDW